MLAHEPEVDYFSLHKRKHKDVDVDMLDYDYVAKCSDVDTLKNILVVLRSGKEGRYPQLEEAVESRLLQVLPPSETARIMRMKATPSESDVHAEIQALAAWETQMAHTSEALDEARKLSNRSLLPPPRGGGHVACTAPVSSERQPKESTPATQKKSKQTISAYDWRAWEKFDVEAAERELDQEEINRRDEARRQQEAIAEQKAKKRLEAAAMPASVDVEAMSNAERQVCAHREKQKGNESFRAGDNEDAIIFYSRSLVFDPTSAIVHANRALVHLKVKNLSSAEEDCTAAIELDPKYFKAWSRRGMARFRRGKYAEAVADFEEALRLDPSNREVQKLLEKTKSKWASVDGTSSAAAEQTAAKPFKRFEIIDTSDDEQETQAVKEIKATKKTEETKFERFEIIEDDEDDDN
ncbi:unnamed protein product [Aphanomyces euteiches]|uniref:Uncharacterized protein n=1 Tax=Aphanomyces euteiches TaxID=100861 RepID=A0A6G0XJ35_9STRA|nr:hypothetical protein Ae201684_004296 [Aphanomyces euteiches]KAH9093881.1 hypothetical protein Ae201684P_016503 [Aphanomyces euteiches]KAH9144454.1 hypothetical protein AeRB84_011612 [Aphanomyces euteiches]